ncbi:MAG: MopE-related protein [Bradymonadia bacterium]
MFEPKCTWRALLTLGAWLLPQTAVAQVGYPLETVGLDCDPAQGRVELTVDEFGAVGSSISIDSEANYDPGLDVPDQGLVSTIFESKAFLCRTTEDGLTDGAWLESGDVGANAQSNADDGGVSSVFTTRGLEVTAHYFLNCTQLELCYTLRNVTNEVMTTVALTPYIDGDLFFNGGLGNDYGGTSIGAPKTVWEFDEGDDPEQPTTFLGLHSLGNGDVFLNSWEIGQFSNQRGRIEDIDGGCAVLRNDLNRGPGMNADRDGDFITDEGYDVTLALRFDLGPLAPDEESPMLCYAVQWGFGRPCSDEDLDEICVPDDNCPTIPNPDQTDEDGDFVGDLCDNCPKVVNPNQSDTDGDLYGDACDRALCVPDGQAEVCDGYDNDCDGLVDQRADGSPVVAPGACATGLSGQCAPGVWGCASGRTRCLPDISPAEELCDVVDNDCDGRVDENARNGCGTCGLPPPEVCNGLDDDCNGAVDDGNAPCPEGQGCSNGRCLPFCGDAGCSGDTFCADGVCVPWCLVDGCLGGLTCTDDGCADPCEGVSCEAGQVCAEGVCGPAHCIHTGCARGERCRPAGCEPDPCDRIDCGADSYCRDGGCVFSCAELSCPAASACFDGVCQPTGCEPVGCPEGGFCVEGTCVGDPCKEVTCGYAEVCDRGNCIADPCVDLDCPRYQRCALVQGTAQCVADWPVIPVPNEPIEDAGVGGSGETELDAEVRRPADASPPGPPSSAADAGAAALGGGGTSGCAAAPGRSVGLGPWALLGLAVFIRRRRVAR